MNEASMSSYALGLAANLDIPVIEAGEHGKENSTPARNGSRRAPATLSRTGVHDVGGIGPEPEDHPSGGKPLGMDCEVRGGAWQRRRVT